MAPLQAPVVRHICSSHKSALLPKAAKEPASKNLFKTRQSLNKTAFLYRDSLKNPKPKNKLAFIDSYLQDSIRVDFNLFKERDNIFFTEIN
jgi:hypothetical protein